MKLFIMFNLHLFYLGLCLHAQTESMVDTFKLVTVPVKIDTTWHENRRTVKEVVWYDAQGQKTITKWDSLGRMRTIFNCHANGAWVGNFVIFDSVGRIAQHMYYFEGYPWAIGYSLFASGDTAGITRVKNDTLYSIDYYTNNAIKTVTYLDKMGHPKEAYYYYSNGMLQTHKKFLEPYYSIYFDSLGQTRFEGWKNPFNASIGKCLYWNADGTRAIEGEWKFSVNQVSTKTGLWKYYDSKGRIVKTEKYRDGKLIETREYKRPRKDKDPANPKLFVPSG